MRVFLYIKTTVRYHAGVVHNTVNIHSTEEGALAEMRTSREFNRSVLDCGDTKEYGDASSYELYSEMLDMRIRGEVMSFLV